MEQDLGPLFEICLNQKTNTMTLVLKKRVHWGSIYEAYVSIYEAYGSLLISKEPFMLKKVL